MAAEVFDILFFGSAALASIEFAVPGTFKKTFVDPVRKPLQKLAVKLTPLGRKFLKAKKLALPGLPVEAAIFFAGQVVPAAPKAAQTAVLEGLRDDPVTTIVVTGSVITALSFGLGVFSIGFVSFGAPAALVQAQLLPTVAGIAGALVLELVIA